MISGSSFTPFSNTVCAPRGTPGIGQHAAGAFDLRGQFVGVIEVQVHIERMILLMISQSLGVMRSGRLPGTRVPIRITSKWGLCGGFENSFQR